MPSRSTALRLRRPISAVVRGYFDAAQHQSALSVIRTPRIQGVTPATRSLLYHPSQTTQRSFSSTPLCSKSSPSSHTSRASASDRTFEKAALGKPSKNTTPSHPTSSATGPGARRRPKTYIYGGELTPDTKAAQAKRRYPNMFPAEGTFMHWFLTSRVVHVFISIGVLTACAVTVFCLEFRRTTPYLDLLPTWGEFFRHPFGATHQVWDVYGQHVAWTSQQTQLAREKNIEDARKRKAYRVAHGLEKPDEGLQGGVQGVDVTFGEKVGVSEREKAALDEETEFEQKVKKAYRESVIKAGGNPDTMERHRDQQGKPKELKKWFGIW